MALLAAGGLLVAGALLIVGFRTVRHGALPSMTVLGTKVGGMDPAAVRSAIAGLAERRAADELEVTRPASGELDAATVRTDLEDLGYRIDVEATVQQILSRGRQVNPVSALLDHLRASFGSVAIAPVVRLDPARFDEWAVATARKLSAPPQEGSLSFQGTDVEPVMPVPGAEVVTETLRGRVRQVIALRLMPAVTATTVPLAPQTDAADVGVVLAQARRALAGPVKLTHGDAAIVFEPKDIAGFLRVTLAPAPSGASGASTASPDDASAAAATAVAVASGASPPATMPSSAGASLELTADPGDVERAAGKQAEAVASDPSRARFQVAGGAVHIVPSKKGFAFDPDRAAEQVVEVATAEGGEREAVLKGKTVAPDFTTKDAQALHITERVSTFTTYYPCCLPRVTNIHTIANIFNGTVIKPGEVLSVNQRVGPRRTEQGFVLAPAIRGGEFVEEIGGGISQFTTTLYNAIFFGGYHIIEHQAHSYYFTRYPLGREATVSWPTPDLKFQNDSDAGIYIATSWTDTSVTVSFYGSTDINVETTTSEPSNFTEPETQCKENPELAKGEQNVTQEGGQGYDVTVKRILEYPDGHSKIETYFTRYKAEPTIVEQRTCA